MVSTSAIIAALTTAVEIGSKAVLAAKAAGAGDLLKAGLPVAKLIFERFTKDHPAIAGIDTASAVSAIQSTFNVGSALLQGGKDVGPVVTMLYQTFVLKTAMSQQELDAFAAETDRLGDELDAMPIPDA